MKAGLNKGLDRRGQLGGVGLKKLRMCRTSESISCSVSLFWKGFIFGLSSEPFRIVFLMKLSLCRDCHFGAVKSGIFSFAPTFVLARPSSRLHTLHLAAQISGASSASAAVVQDKHNSDATQNFAI